MIEAYPLYWPEGRPKTKDRSRARFNTTFAKSRDELMVELSRLGAIEIILSSNIRLRSDGLPYAGEKEPKDPAIAVYFKHKGKQYCFASDRWDRAKDNMHAIKLTVEAVRGIERWGTSDMMEQAFKGFQALPSGQDEWWVVLGIPRNATPEQIKDAMRAQARVHHPDCGGSDHMMAKINEAYQKALLEIKIHDQR